MTLDRRSLRNRFESIGEDAVRAELRAGRMSTLDKVRAQHWLKEKAETKEQNQLARELNQQGDQWFRWAIGVLIALVAIGVAIWAATR